MSEGLNVLKELGAQRIHKETHITKEYIQAILHESFDGMNSVQFVGFISILEREYKVDLSDLKAKGEEYFSKENTVSAEDKKVFVVPKKSKSYVKLYLWLAVVIFSAFLYYIFVYMASPSMVNVEKIDNTKIQNAQESIAKTIEVKDVVIDVNETNSSVNKTVVVDKNITKEEKVEEKLEPKAQKERTLKLIPKYKIWVGYIDIKTNQKYQKIFKNTFTFDATKDWLLLFGGGNVKLEVNGEIKKFSSKQNLRFKYVDGELTKISVEEFKSLNKGRKW